MRRKIMSKAICKEFEIFYLADVLERRLKSRFHVFQCVLGHFVVDSDEMCLKIAE